MCGSQKNKKTKKCDKLPFLVNLGKKNQFWTVFDQNGQNGENYKKKALGTFFSCLQALTVKFQKKVMNGFGKKA